jgi:hypothetical protein
VFCAKEVVVTVVNVLQVGKWDVRIGTGLNWLRIRSIGGLLCGRL